MAYAQPTEPLSRASKTTRRCLKACTIGLATSCFTLFSTATLADKVYGELGLNHVMVDIGQREFSVQALEARMGYYLQPQVGIELHAMTALTDDAANNTKLKLPLSNNILLRFESPEREGGKVFLLAGYGQTTLELDRNGSGKPGSENFYQGNFGGGIEFALGKANNTFINLKWHRYYAEGGIDIDAVGLGLRMRF